MNALSLYYLGRALARNHIPLLPRVCEALIYLIFNCSIPVSAEIGSGSRCGHRGIGVVVHRDARIGRRCVLAANVLIGGAGGGHTGVPIIGDDVFIGAGAKLLGHIRVGDGAVIGANAVVLDDVPAGATAVGVPARIVSTSRSAGGGSEGARPRLTH